MRDREQGDRDARVLDPGHDRGALLSAVSRQEYRILQGVDAPGLMGEVPRVLDCEANFIRRLVWTAGTWPLRLLRTAETGRLGAILTRNLLAVAKP